MVCKLLFAHKMHVLTIAATSNDPWGPVGSDMAEIAQITFNK
jgi:hypothetical protein